MGYHINSSIKIAIYEDRIEFFSPGSFSSPLTTENLKLGVSYIRNMAICKVFREAKYIEKLGSGFPTIFKCYKEKNLTPPSIIEGENFIKCVLPRESLTEKTEEIHPILNLFHFATNITISDIVSHLKISRTSAGRQLQDLISEGKIQKTGKGRAISYLKCD